ncbi:MAG: phosphoesterase [Campylobacterales bacterium]|nr:phosphoesterase [Campylobacterales bacterium]
MRVYHLSHIDLDGYGCQFITNRYFEDKKYFNANYGKEVIEKLNSIIHLIENSEIVDNFILITDLNLTFEESRYLDLEVKRLNELDFNIKLQLLDHHKSGIDSAGKFDWYYLDNSRSATKITFDYFKTNYSDVFIDDIEKLIDSINAVDIWLENDSNFEFGKVCMRLIMDTNEINRFNFLNEHRDYKFFALNKAIEYLNIENGHILLDDNILKIKKEYLKKDIYDTLDILSSEFVSNLLIKNKDVMTIRYKDRVGLFTYSFGSISVVANRFLKKASEFDFFMDLNTKGAFSLRANGKIDVSLLAKELAGGGGHANASGGKFGDFSESYSYQKAIEFVQQKLNDIS